MAGHDYTHLGLRDWPFRIVPEPAFCDFLADRGSLKKELASFITALENRPTSDIQLLWSWYGAGKTHTLYYLANRCAVDHQQLLPIYTELPREAKGFFDLYRSTVSQLPIDGLIDAYLDQLTAPTRVTGFNRAVDTDLKNAVTKAALGQPADQLSLEQWLLGNPLGASSLRELGVGGRVQTTEKCTTVLADTIQLLTVQKQNASSIRRVVWILDEVQRVEDLSPSAQSSILSGMVGVFNRCPTGLTILMSYTGEPREKELPEWIPQDLSDRIGLERPLLLPPLGPSDAKVFVAELLRHFRPEGYSDSRMFFPFTEDAIDLLISALARENNLKPRRVMETLDASLRELEPALLSGNIAAINGDALKNSLSRLAISWDSTSRRRVGAGKNG